MLKTVFAAASAAVAIASPAFAQDAHAGHSDKEAAVAAVAAATPTARLNLDTPVEVIVADAAGKAVLDAEIPELTVHEHYNAFKQMGLRQLANYAPDKLTPEVLAHIEAQLAVLK